MIRPALSIRYWPLALAALGGCQTPPETRPPYAVAAPVVSAPAVAAASHPAPRPTLIDEQRRLAALFHGTPVVFAPQSGGNLRVDVPLRFCFERGQATVKPALAAVLDRLAQSQRDASTRFQLSASGDVPPKARTATPPAPAAARASAAARTALAARRAASVRDRLASQGVTPDRTTIVAESDPGGVRLLVSEPPAP